MWIQSQETVIREDNDGNEVEVPVGGRPRIADWMRELLTEHDYDPDEHLPIDWSENDTANVPEPLGDELVSRKQEITLTEGGD